MRKSKKDKDKFETTRKEKKRNATEIRQPNNMESYAMEPKKVSQVGLHLMKFCAKHDMQRIADNVQQYAEALNAKYA